MSVKLIKEIITVFESDVVIGYMARRSVIAGIASGIPNGWVICGNIRVPNWIGNYSTRREAREVLQQIRREYNAKLYSLGTSFHQWMH